jgi:VHL beta domain
MTTSRRRSTPGGRPARSAGIVALLLAVGVLAAPAASADAAAPVGVCTVNSGAAGPVTFVNNTAGPVLVDWVAPDCTEKTYATLAPGTSYVQSTYSGHIWRIRSATTAAALTDPLPVVPRSVVMAQTDPVCPVASAGSVAVSWSLKNATTTKLDVYWLDGQCNEVRYATVAAGASFAQQTYVGHRWRLKVAGTDRVVGETTVLRAGTATFSTAAPTVLARSTADRRDTTTAAKTKVLYAVPSGGTDRRWDVNGRIGLSVAAGNQWLSDQSGGRTLRMDTSGGALDITYVRLPQTAAQYSSYGVYARDHIESDLKARGFTAAANRKYLTYYEGPGTACGTSYRPPGFPGVTSVIFLQSCGAAGLTGEATRFGFAEAGWVHEVFHSLGAAADCAPHQIKSGHVSEDPSDLMYGGLAQWRPALLDVGRDDYWTPTSGTCPGLLGSPFIA